MVHRTFFPFLLPPSLPPSFFCCAEGIWHLSTPLSLALRFGDCKSIWGQTTPVVTRSGPNQAWSEQRVTQTWCSLLREVLLRSRRPFPGPHLSHVHHQIPLSVHTVSYLLINCCVSRPCSARNKTGLLPPSLQSFQSPQETAVTPKLYCYQL